MSLSLHPRAEYTLCVYSGPFSARDLDALTAELVDYSRSSGVTRLAVDITASRGELSIFERYEHAVRFANVLPRGTRVAVIARSDQILEDRFWQTVALNRAAPAGVFTELEPALAWLLADAGDAETAHASDAKTAPADDAKTSTESDPRPLECSCR
jgi:hypothetical protein